MLHPIGDLAARGQDIYEDRLTTVLEPEHNNEYVAIDVESGEWAIGRSFTRAMRALTGRTGIDGRLHAMRIGPEPDYLLSSRVIGQAL